MSQDFSSSATPLPPLNVGNVVSSGVVLYRSHLKQYLGIAFLGTLWSTVPILALVPIGLVAANVPIALLLLIPVWLVLLFYCVAKFLLNSALISRLAFGELVSKPETTIEAREQISGRLWKFLRVALSVGLRIALIYIGLAILGAISIGIITAVAAIALGQSAGAVVVALLSVLLILAIIGVLLWYISRWLVAELPLAIEGDMTVSQSVDRSWQLTKTSVRRIILVATVAFLVTLPLVAVTSYIPQIFLVQQEPGTTTYWLIYGVSLVTSLAGNVVVLPFWQSIKAVLYYDLRNRREGLGLQLKDR